MMIILLLGFIGIIESIRLFMLVLPVSEKKHFKQKLKGVEKMIWDLNFKVFKTREIKEDVRKGYDKKKAKLFGLEEQIKNWPKDKDEADRKRLEDEITRINQGIERGEQQMKMLDMEIDGAQPSEQYPEGVQGISQQVDGLMELRQMLKDWLRTL